MKKVIRRIFEYLYHRPGQIGPDRARTDCIKWTKRASAETRTLVADPEEIVADWIWVNFITTSLRWNRGGHAFYRGNREIILFFGHSLR